MDWLKEIRHESALVVEMVEGRRTGREAANPRHHRTLVRAFRTL